MSYKRCYRGVCGRLGASEADPRFSRLEVDVDEPAPSRQPPKTYIEKRIEAEAERERSAARGERSTVYELDCRKRHVRDFDFPRVSRAEDVAAIANEVLGDRLQESILAIHLDARNKVVGYEEVAKGTVSGVSTTPVEVFRSAIVTPTVQSVILVHNHPSGEADPSEADKEITAKMRMAGEIVGIPLLDHVVVGGHGRYYSMAQERTRFQGMALFSIFAALIGGGIIYSIWNARRGARGGTAA
jgi:DNA repair protein RadC